MDRELEPALREMRATTDELIAYYQQGVTRARAISTSARERGDVILWTVPPPVTASRPIGD